MKTTKEKRLKKLLLVLCLLTGVAQADTRIVTGVDYSKAINWHSGLEMYVKGTTTLDDSIDLKYGLSEQYDGDRATPFSFNHSGLRWDTGILFHIGRDMKIGYTHSGRWNISGCNEESIFQKHSIDSFSFRKELSF